MNQNEKILHIKAESRLISVNGLFPERIAYSVLLGIKEAFEYLVYRYSEPGKEKLTVKICTHNPELF